MNSSGPRQINTQLLPQSSLNARHPSYGHYGLKTSVSAVTRAKVGAEAGGQTRGEDVRESYEVSMLRLRGGRYLDLCHSVITLRFPETGL